MASKGISRLILLVVFSYGSKSDYYSEKNKLLFTKIKSAIKYFKD